MTSAKRLMNRSLTSRDPRLKDRRCLNRSPIMARKKSLRKAQVMARMASTDDLKWRPRVFLKMPIKPAPKAAERSNSNCGPN